MRKNKIKNVLTIVKYLFALTLTFVSWLRVGNEYYLVMGLIELAIIFMASNILIQKKKMGFIVNSVFLLLYNVQMAVLAFANSYITMVMLTNIDSIKALSGKAGIYIGAVVLTLVFSFLPVSEIKFSRKVNRNLLGIILYVELLFLGAFGKMFSPVYGYIDLGIQQYQSVKLAKEIAEASQNTVNEETAEVVEKVDYSTEMEYDRRNDLMRTDFYQPDVEDFRAKNDDLVEQPNVILIFTEGLSQNVISDERRIMPNVAEYQGKSLRFTNYYNHTFATYRGLIGQLFSGYQLEDFDSNSLVSLQEILGMEGYQTAFINTEPNNKEFTAYLNNFGFHQLLGDEYSVCNGMADSISDKDAYEMLFQVAEEKGKDERPFFLSVYTFGTHASLDSTDQKFGDGNDAELNKFYDADYQFGVFMKKFEDSALAEDTIIIFTTDHATYQDDSFTAAFPEYERAATSIDEIPFFIYYKGIEAEEMDVAGRNSICLTPTILDYLDISAPNCFVGTSLFSGQTNSICETSYTDSYVAYSSKDGGVCSLSSVDLESFNDIVRNYYIAKVSMGID